MEVVKVGEGSMCGPGLSDVQPWMVALDGERVEHLISTVHHWREGGRERGEGERERERKEREMGGREGGRDDDGKER